MLDLITFKKLNVYVKYRKFLIEKVLKINYKFIDDTKPISNGFVIANHKSGFDNVFDSYVSNSFLIGKNNVKYYHGLFYFLQYFNKDILLFDKNNTNRHQLYSLIKKYMKINKKNKAIFYPEGTRINFNYKSQNDILKHIKYGLLKSVYEKKEIIQMLISINKEFPFSCINLPILCKYSEPIDPNNFKTFEEFYLNITELWFNYLNLLNDKYNSRNLIK